MNKILLRQATITSGYKFYVTGVGNTDSYTLNSTSFIIATLDRFIGNIIGIPFTAVISKSSKDDEIIFKKKFGFFSNAIQS